MESVTNDLIFIVLGQIESALKAKYNVTILLFLFLISRRKGLALG